jgi:hypothetical protein
MRNCLRLKGLRRRLGFLWIGVWDEWIVLRFGMNFNKHIRKRMRLGRQ